jgi:hypothetical protein
VYVLPLDSRNWFVFNASAARPGKGPTVHRKVRGRSIPLGGEDLTKSRTVP